MKFYKFLPIVCLAFLVFNFSCSKEKIPTVKEGTLTVATYHAFAPVCSREEGKAVGRDIEFLRSFAESQELDVEFVFYEFDKIWTLPGAGVCDLASAGIAPLPSRDSEGCSWSDAYFEVYRSLLTRNADKDKLKTIADFSGMRIAVTQGSTAEIDAVMRKDVSVELVYYTDQNEAVQDLIEGKIDGFGEGDVSNYYLAEKQPDLLAVTDVHPMSPLETFSVSVRNESNILIALNEFIKNNKDKY